MGVVFLAQDPALDRSLAVKLVRHSRSAEESRRLRREAQALARLSHPNVVQVFEVGSVDARMYIAMEYVPGEDLRLRLRRKSNESRDLREALLQVGRGLAAAHHEGLVHRDIKPSNVLLGDDGRARLVDFGLAQGTTRSMPSTTRWSASAGLTYLGACELDERLTEQGSVVGTPAYMAPEQLEGAAPSERSDQFGYCVMAAEVILGRHPFDRLAPTEAQIEALDGMRPVDPVWARWWPLIRRGLSMQPSLRWPSMGALIEAMERAECLPHRGGLALLGGLVLGCLGLGVVGDVRARDESSCQLVRGQASADRGALESLASLEPGGACLGREPVDAHRTSKDSLQGTVLAELQALVDAEQLSQAESVAMLLRQRVAELTDPSLRLRAEYWLGMLDAKQGRYAQAEARLERAYFGARVERMDTTAFEAAVEVSHLVGNELQRLDDGLEWVRHGRAVSQRMSRAPGHLDRLVRLDILEGGLRSAKGQHHQALSLLEDAIVNLESHRGEHPLLEARARCLLGNAWGRSGDGLEAERELRRCLEIERAVLGPHSPRLISTLGNLGNALLLQQRSGDALPLFAEALEISQVVHGPTHIETAMAHLQYASALDDDGQLAAARDAYRRGIGRLESIQGPDHPWISLACNNLGMLLRRMGDHTQARVLLLRALDVRERTLGPEHPGVLTPLINLISLDIEHGRFGAARAYLERALALIEGTDAEISPDDEATIRRQWTDVERAERAADPRGSTQSSG